MKQRKWNTAPRYLLGLVLLLTAACLIGAVGVSYARYRTAVEGSIYFKARAPEIAYLGQLNAERTEFVLSDSGTWVTENGKTTMRFAVANGPSLDDYANEDMEVWIRPVGSLGFCSEDTVTLTLSVPKVPDEAENNPEGETTATDATESETVEYDTYTATARRIPNQSPLYTTFGDGWVFSFQDEEETEISWQLEGGKHTFVEMILTIDGVQPTDLSLLQLQVTGRSMQK